MISKRFDETLLLLDTRQSEYYALNEAGRTVWEHLLSGRTPRELTEGDLQAGDVTELIQELVRLKLLVAKTPGQRP